MIRRISPFALPVAVAAFALGTLVDGTDAGWSAAIAIVVVYLNFVAHGSSLALAATISPTLIASLGQAGLQASQAVQSSVIISAMVYFS